MRKKKLTTKSNKLQKFKPRIGAKRKIYKSDIEDEEVIVENDQDNENIEELDEFESLQDLAHEPGTLHEHYENEAEEEEELVVEEEEQKPKQKAVEIQEELTARGNKNKHYVKPEEFESLIQGYYKKGVLTNDLCDCVYKIANRLSYRPNFVNYSFREEMVSDAIERMIFALSNRVYKYNPKKIGKNGKKGNAFLYFTKIAENAFINRIKIESRNRETITNYQEDVYINLLQKGIDLGGGNTDTSDI